MKILSLQLLILLLSHYSSAYIVSNTFYGTVQAGEVKYYTLESQSTVVLALYSLEGDADMYGSPTSKNSKPSADSFEYMSASCGLDIMVVPMNEGVRRVSVGVFGHIRHDTTHYQVWVVEPEEVDKLRYQVWEYSQETMTNQLVIDVDPLFMANDPSLHNLLDTLHSSGINSNTPQSTTVNALRTLLEWTGFILLKMLEIGVEILV